MAELADVTDVHKHVKETKESLEDIEEDLDCLKEMLERHDECTCKKKYGKEEESGMDGFDSGLLAGMIGNKGVDPNLVAMMNNCCKDGNWGQNGGMLMLLFLVLLLGGGNGFGWGNRNGVGAVDGVDRTVVNATNYTQLMDAITTQGTRHEMAIQNLATNLNCDVNSIKSALCGIDKAIAVSNGDLKSAIQTCCCNIRTELMQAQNAIQAQAAQCCCETNRNIDATRCTVENEAQQTRFLIQTTDAATRQLIQQQFCDQNAYLAQQFCDIRSREDARQIQALRDQLEQERTSAQTALLLNAINGTKNVSARYNATDNTVCGTVGGNCCCRNRIPATAPATPPVEEAEPAPARSKKATKAE